MRDKNELLDLFRSLFGEKRTEHEYANIFFGVSAKSQFSQFLKKRHSEKTVIKGICRALSLSWYDGDIADKDIPSIDNVVDAVERIERERCDKFASTFCKMAMAICETCDETKAMDDERAMALLKILWGGECMLLSRSSKVDFATMKKLSLSFEKAAAKTLSAYPLLSKCVQSARLVALRKMGRTWREAIENLGTDSAESLYDRRKSVLDVYSRFSGRALDPKVIQLFCGQRKKFLERNNAESR